jgi:RNA polymerase sigma factor (sigma-70 family)
MRINLIRSGASAPRSGKGAVAATDFMLHQQLEILYAEHHGWLQGWLRGRLGDSFIAADLAQDTFVSVIKAGSAAEIRTPRPFLVTIARRLMAHRHRRQLLETSYLELLTALPEESAPSPEAQLLALEALQQIDRALDGLAPQVREAFLLAHLEELSYAQIAERLAVSTSSVKQYLTRANRQCLFALAP